MHLQVCLETKLGNALEKEKGRWQLIRPSNLAWPNTGRGRAQQAGPASGPRRDPSRLLAILHKRLGSINLLRDTMRTIAKETCLASITL